MLRSRSFEQYLLLMIILFFFFWMSLGILKPIVLGLFVALVLDPVRAGLQQKLSKSIKSNSLKFLAQGHFISAVLTVLFIGFVLFPSFISSIVTGKQIGRAHV